MATKLTNRINEKAKEKIHQAVRMLLNSHGLWGITALRMDYEGTTAIPKLSTDGKVIRYNPEWVYDARIGHIIFGVAHEICHCELLHHTRRDNRDPELWNRSVDLTVNSILDEAGLDRPEWCLFEAGSEKKAPEDIYASLIDKKNEDQGSGQEESDDSDDSDNNDQSQDESSDDSQDQDSNEESDNDQQDDKDSGSGNSQDDSEGDSEGDEAGNDSGAGGQAEDESDEASDAQDGQSGAGGSSDGEPDPDATPDKFAGSEPDWNIGHVEDFSEEPNADPSDEEARWKIISTQSMNMSKECGGVPGFFKEMIQEIIDPAISVKDLLREFVELNCKNDYTLAAPNRRYLHNGLYLPSLRSESLSNVSVFVDTSISVSRDELKEFSGIVSSVLEEYDTLINVFHIDTAVKEVEKFESSDLPIEIGYRGRGGTAFIPGFDYIENSDDEDINSPTCVIYLTDGGCYNFPEEPDYPVIWVISGQGDKNFHERCPFGEVVYCR